VYAIEFDESNAGGFAFAAQDRSPITLDQGREDRRFAIVLLA